MKATVYLARPQGSPEKKIELDDVTGWSVMENTGVARFRRRPVGSDNDVVVPLSSLEYFTVEGA